jgi:hypothetical protein
VSSLRHEHLDEAHQPGVLLLVVDHDLFDLVAEVVARRLEH